MFDRIIIEVVSKPQIRFKGKASRGLKTERTRKYVSISIRERMHLNTIRSMLNQALRDNTAIEPKMRFCNHF